MKLLFVLLLTGCSVLLSQQLYSTDIGKDSVSLVKEGDDFVFTHSYPACIGTSSKQRTETKVTFASSQLVEKEASLLYAIPNLLSLILKFVGVL